MSKYINAEKLKETIKYHIRCLEKELQSFSDEDYVCSTAAQYAAEKATLENVQNIIDSLKQEQPEVDLETFDKSVTKMWERCAAEPNDTIACLHIESFIEIARHFAQWGAEHLKK